MNAQDRLRMRSRIWWAKQWVDPSELYRVRTMNDEEAEKAEEILRTIPRYGFDCHPDRVADLPDARIVCEALATGGQLLVSANLGIARKGIINAWATKNQERFGIRNPDMIINADVWLRTRLGGLGTEESLIQGAKLALAAFWPYGERATLEQAVRAAVESTRPGRTRTSPFRECLGEAHGMLLKGTQPGSSAAIAWAGEVQESLPVRMRGSEHRHPAMKHVRAR